MNIIPKKPIEIVGHTDLSDQMFFVFNRIIENSNESGKKLSYIIEKKEKKYPYHSLKILESWKS